MEFLGNLFGKKTTDTSSDSIARDLVHVSLTTHPGQTVSVHTARTEAGLFGALYERLLTQDTADHILITGRQSYRAWSHGDKGLHQKLRNGYSTVLEPPSDPTSEATAALLQEFQKYIRDNATHRQVCFTPAVIEDVQRYLFFLPNERLSSKAEPTYRASVYFIGMHEKQLSNIQLLLQCMNKEGRAEGTLECFIAFYDNMLLLSERKILATASTSDQMSAAWERIFESSQSS